MVFCFVLIGVVFGVGYGFYWLVFNVLIFEIMEFEMRDFFNGFLGILFLLVGMIGLIVVGYVILRFENNMGYIVIFSLLFGLFVFVVVMSFFLKWRELKGCFMLKKVFDECYMNLNWCWIINVYFF